MLSLNDAIGYIHEPFNKVTGISGIDRWYPYVREGDEVESRYAHHVQRVLDGEADYQRLSPWRAESLIKGLGRALFGGRPAFDYLKATWDPRVKRFLIKDPLASLMSLWLTRKFEMKGVVMVRHPASFVASRKRRGWNYSASHYVPRDCCGYRFFEEAQARAGESQSLVAQNAVLWTGLNKALSLFVEETSSLSLFRVENVWSETIETFEKMYSFLDIPFKIREKKIAVEKTFDKKDEWEKIISKKEKKLVKRITEPVSKKIYDW
jgi:hypothetical protein